MRVYVVSSWRNKYQQGVVNLLREIGLDVYDFRRPEHVNEGFTWSEIDPHWLEWAPDQYRRALKHSIACHGYALDIEAVRSCDVGLLVLPAGKSASFELGYVMGMGKPGYVYVPETCELDLMFVEATFLTREDELRTCFLKKE